MADFAQVVLGGGSARGWGRASMMPDPVRTQRHRCAVMPSNRLVACDERRRTSRGRHSAPRAPQRAQKKALAPINRVLRNRPGIISQSFRNHGPSCGKVSRPCHLADRRTGLQPGPRRVTCGPADVGGLETVWRPAPNTRQRKIRRLFPARSLTFFADFLMFLSERGWPLLQMLGSRSRPGIGFDCRRTIEAIGRYAIAVNEIQPHLGFVRTQFPRCPGPLQAFEPPDPKWAELVFVTASGMTNPSMSCPQLPGIEAMRGR